MLESDKDHPGTLIGHPILGEFRPSPPPGIILIGSGEVKTIGRSQGKVPLDVIHRIIHIRMFLVAFGQQDRRPQIDGLSPELGEDLTLEFDALHPRCVFGDFDGWDDIFATERYGICLGWIDLDLDHIANDVTRRPGPSLSFPLVVVDPYCVAIRALEFCVDIHNSLDIVLTGWDVLYALERISKHLLIYENFFACFKRFHILPEKGDSVCAHLESWFSPFVLGNDDEYTTSDGSGAGFRCEGNGEFEPGLSICLRYG
jgi:hypothetical protein